MNGPGLIPRPLAYGLIVLIAGLWGADVIASIVDEGHELNTTLGTAFLVVAGLLGGLSRGRGQQPAEPAEQDDEQGDEQDGEAEQLPGWDDEPVAATPRPPRPPRRPPGARPAGGRPPPRRPPTVVPDDEPLPPGAVPFEALRQRLEQEQRERDEGRR